MTFIDGLELERSLYKAKIINGVKDRGLVSLDRKKEVSFFLFYYEFYSFF